MIIMAYRWKSSVCAEYVTLYLLIKSFGDLQYIKESHMQREGLVVCIGSTTTFVPS